jgi:hypothetical protein
MSSQHPRLFAEVEKTELPLHLTVADADTIFELSMHPEGGPRETFALTALRIGVMAMRQARGQLDAGVLRSESERLLIELNSQLKSHSQQVNQHLHSALATYFDPKSGRFTDRVQRLIDKDGDLENVLRRQVGAEDSELCKTLANHFGEQSPLMKMLDPDQSKGILAGIRETLKLQLQEQREHVIGQFSLDDDSSALSRFIKELSNQQGELSDKLRTKIDEVVKEFSLDNEESALSRLVRNVDRAQRTITNQFSLDDDTSALARLKRELSKMLQDQREADQKFQEEVKGALQAMAVRKEEAGKSTRHGLEFEDAMCEFVRQDAQPRDDIATATGNSVGRIKACKVGDCVLELGPESAAPGAKIVLEAKEDMSYTVARARTELERARKNRDAQIGIFVFSKKTAPTGIDSLRRYGDDILVVWDAELPASDIYLDAALTVARALIVRSCRNGDELSEVDFDSMDKALLEIEKRLVDYEQIITWAETIRNNSDKIINKAENSRKSVIQQLETIRTTTQDTRQVVRRLLGKTDR